MLKGAYSLQSSTLRELYEQLLNANVERAIVRGEDNSDGGEMRNEHRFCTTSLVAIHSLDLHAIRLLARVGQVVTLALDQLPSAYLQARTLAGFSSFSSAQENSSAIYQPGAILTRFLRAPNARLIWHDYLTSRDCVPHACLFAGATLDAQFPHLRAGFLTGIDLFHAGEYYAAHEDWESLWMRLNAGAERSTAQSFIQLAGAHIHRLKNRSYEARKLYANSRQLLQTIQNDIEWLGVANLIETSDSIFETCDATQNIAWPEISLRVSHAGVARKHRASKL